MIRLATRKSKLALEQARLVADAVAAASGAACDLVLITTSGDRAADRSLAQIGGDGIFTKELIAALLAGRADAAVHSMKDLPTDLPEQVRYGVVPAREDARDVLLSAGNRYRGLDALPRGAAVGTSSLRRAAQLRARRPDLDVRPLRGNVDTRVRKLLAGAFDAIVLAMAGVKRIGLLEAVGGGHPLPVEEMVPAVAQGALYVQRRADDALTAAAIAPLDHEESALATAMERAFLCRIGGGCLVPAGAYAMFEGGRWHMTACVAAVDGSRAVRCARGGRREAKSNLLAAAEAIADEMLEAGARDIVLQSRVRIPGQP